MIISASRRTDIPAFYSEWFINRLKEGHVLIPNPYDPKRLGYAELSPKNVDCIVFWTKNPTAMTDRFHLLDSMGYSYCVHFTLTPYEKDVETFLPPKPRLVQAFRKMAEHIGPLRSIWRYDPVIVDSKHTVEWHLNRFEDMCKLLHGSTERCFISFVDPYKSLEKRFRTLTDDEMSAIASGFSGIASENNIKVFTCAENADLSRRGIEHGACIDSELIERIIGHRISAKKDNNQRDACRCIESVDVGTYGTCPHGCSYCYATSSQNDVTRRMAAHDPNSPLITGHPKGDEIITDRTSPSQMSKQSDLFRFE